MSSPRDPQEDTGDRLSHDDAEEPQPGTDAGDDTTSPQETQPVKRRRGRPPGSKNKDTAAQPSAPPATSTTTSAPRKRGRPRKSINTDKENQPRPEDTGEEPPVKRSRGRPRKNPQPTESAEAEGSEAPPKRKRGRPKKTTT